MRALTAIVVLSAAIACGCATRTSAPFPHAVVAADHAIASRAGAEILRKGGNAVDAAVATSFALSVVRPYSCGIGGGGFMVIRFDGDPKFGTRSIALNYRETAPAAVNSAFYDALDDDSSKYGAKAVAVPGTVAGLLYALEHYGTLDRATVLAPAIRAAEEGFIVDAHYVASARDPLKWFLADPARQQRYRFVWERFLREGHVTVGNRITLPEQAAALRRIAEQGRVAFYEGDIADQLVSAIRDDGGTLTIDDLAKYQVKEVEPLTFEAMGHTFVTMPPPSSGGVVLAESFGILSIRGTTDPHVLVEAWKHAFADRARWMGDPEFVDVPVARLTSREYLTDLANRVDASTTQPIESYGSVPPDDHGTSHFCVIDAHGNAVSCTETINLEFGSLVAVNKYGFALNDEMDDFTTKAGKANAFKLQQSRRNAPAPGKRPLSSMTPTIVLDRDGHVEVIAGASGGPRIITGTMQAIMNVIERDMSATAAVSAPRLHHQWMPDVLLIEPALYERYEADGTLARLRAMGHDIRVATDDEQSNVQLIRRAAGGYDAASDPRKGGSPAGY